VWTTLIAVSGAFESRGREWRSEREPYVVDRRRKSIAKPASNGLGLSFRSESSSRRTAHVP
jgi:hypothetical protein